MGHQRNTENHNLVLMRIIPILSIVLLCAVNAFADGDSEFSGFGDCTIGVFGRDVTSDSRPIIWKNRDVGNPDQRFIYCAPHIQNGFMTLAFTGDCYRNDTTRIYMGANERGFAIMNSDSYNLGDSLSAGIDDGTLMRLALETCYTLSDFEALLDSTNLTGRRDCWNFGCLDSTGASALYECANHWYAKYTPEEIQERAARYIIRANFSVCGGGSHSGQDRNNRAESLVESRMAAGEIDAAFVLEYLARDLGNIYDDPYPLPYDGVQLGGPAGYIYNLGVTICNRSTTSAVAIRGARGDEPAFVTTIFGMLGQPILSTAFPLWVGGGEVPVCLSRPQGAPILEYCASRSGLLYDNPRVTYHLNSHYLLDENGHGVFSYSLPLERWGINETDLLLETWHSQAPSGDELRSQQNRIANVIFAGYSHETAGPINEFPSEPPLPHNMVLSNYPNPFNGGTYIIYSAPVVDSPVSARIFDILGRQVAEVAGDEILPGTIYWNGRDSRDNELKSGVYLYILNSGSVEIGGKMLLIK